MSGRLFSYYGDDFTGSTDALEALAANGVESVLFTDPPDETMLAPFADCRAIGVAGESRSRTPEWMSQHLPGIFQSLRQLGAPVCQYKICSTFDSSPQVGSIGRALEIGRQVFGSAYVPIAVAAPHLRRYVLFGNLFAAGGGAIHRGIYRIDRHPTMRHHPVTPMDESDLRLHLARQTDCAIALLDILALREGNAPARLASILADQAGAVLFDGLDECSQRETGRLIWSEAQPFAVGSSGLTHALIHHWREAGLISREATPGEIQPVDRLIVISGSCSPVTAAQIRHAVRNGFDGIRFHATTPKVAPEDVLPQAVKSLHGGKSVVLYTALGAQDCADPEGPDLGRRLGVLLRDLLLLTAVRRVVVAGGDTSSHAVQQLGISALTFVAETTPGAPLCRAHSRDPAMDGVELVLKGGQVGPENYFEMILRGKR